MTSVYVSAEATVVRIPRLCPDSSYMHCLAGTELVEVFGTVLHLVHNNRNPHDSGFRGDVGARRLRLLTRGRRCLYCVLCMRTPDPQFLCICKALAYDPLKLFDIRGWATPQLKLCEVCAPLGFTIDHFCNFMRLIPQLWLATMRRKGSSGWRLEPTTGESGAFTTSPLAPRTTN